MATYSGSCHCGRVRFRVRGELRSITVCNCSICTKKGFLHWIVEPSRFELLAGASELTHYRFNTGAAEHTFCRTCGMHPFYTPRSDPDKVDVNVRCLEGVDIDELPVRTFDGQNWEGAIESAHWQREPPHERREPGVLLDSRQRIAVIEPLRAVNAALLELVSGFSAADWTRPTVHRDRDVKDLVAHLLHGTLRRVSSLRDGYRRAMQQSVESAQQLVDLIQRDNRRFMDGMRGVSPQLLCELIARYDPELVRLLAALDPDAPGLGVVWAGEWVSSNWFDVAREYTEKWHHQEQLRDAVGAPALYEPELLVPVLETFARGLPFAYRDCDAPEGTAVAVSIEASAKLSWTLRRTGANWSLWSGGDDRAATKLTLSADRAWRLWTKGVPREEVRERIEIEGEARYADPLLSFVAIMA